MDKTLEHLKETLEDEIKKITKKGDITPAELESVQKAVCTIDMIDKMGNGQSEGMMMEGDSHGWNTRMPYYGHNGRSYGRSYGEDSYGYYHDSYGDDMYSNRRGRSPVTGRYISRDGGYSGHSIMDRMVARLEDMYDEAKTDHERQTVEQWINRLRQGN
jgi:hypothetical protein